MSKSKFEWKETTYVDRKPGEVDVSNAFIYRSGLITSFITWNETSISCQKRFFKHETTCGGVVIDYGISNTLKEAFTNAEDFLIRLRKDITK